MTQQTQQIDAARQKGKDLGFEAARAVVEDAAIEGLTAKQALARLQAIAADPERHRAELAEATSPLMRAARQSALQHAQSK